MKFTLAAAAALISTALAAPAYSAGSCLSQSDAETIVNRYASIQSLTSSDLGGPKKTARKLLAPEFQETSDSLNELIGIALDSVTFSNKKSYIQAVTNTTPATLNTYQVLVSNCNYITWYWNANPGSGTIVKGFHLFETNSALQITEAWLEFNSIAWNEDLGGSCTIAQPSKRLLKL